VNHRLERRVACFQSDYNMCRLCTENLAVWNNSVSISLQFPLTKLFCFAEYWQLQYEGSYQRQLCVIKRILGMLTWCGFWYPPSSLVKVRCTSLFCIILFRAAAILFYGTVMVTVRNKMRTYSQISHCMKNVLMSTGQCCSFLLHLKIRESSQGWWDGQGM
jgi:hypothetical protein